MADQFIEGREIYVGVMVTIGSDAPSMGVCDDKENIGQTVDRLRSGEVGP